MKGSGDPKQQTGSERTGSLTEAEEAELIRYLLNDLSQSEKDRIEERYFGEDEAYYAALEGLETELVRDYAVGALSHRQTRLFEARLASDVHLRTKVAAVRGLVSMARLPPRRAFHPIEPRQFLVIAAGLTLGFVLAGAGVYYFARISNRINGIQAKLDSLSQAEMASSASVSDRFDPTFSLIAGLRRASETRAPISVSAKARNVHLKLGTVSRGGGPLKIALRTIDSTVELWSTTVLDNDQIEISIPAALIDSGDYVLVATTIAGDEIESWSFRVFRKN